MKVNSVSLNSNQSFGNYGQKEFFAGLTDNDLRNIAYQKASLDVDDKKHRKINNMLYFSVPLVAGIASAAKTASRVGRVFNFGLGFASWAVPFMIVDAAIGSKRFAQKHISSVKDFTEKHPIIASVGTLAASIFAYTAVTRGGVKALTKYGTKISKVTAPYVEKLSNALENSKVLDKIAGLTKKLPSSAKDVAKTILNWSPWMLLVANISHSFNHERVKASEAINNYQDLKETQEAIRSELAEV